MIKNFFKKLKTHYLTRKEILEKEGLKNLYFNSHGFVLILTLLLSSILVTVSTEFLLVAKNNTRYMLKNSQQLKARMIANSGVEMAFLVLKVDQKGLPVNMITGNKVDKNIDCYQDLWGVKFPDIPVTDDASVRIKIEDLNSKINISALANDLTETTPYYGILQRLFLDLGLSIDLCDIIIDWTDSDDNRFPYGAENGDYYQSLPIPYKANNQEFDSINQLLLLKDFTPKIFYGLIELSEDEKTNMVVDNHGKTSINKNLIGSDFLQGQDENEENKIGPEISLRLDDYLRVNGYRKDFTHRYNKINVNTASYRVLSSLTDEMNPDKVTEIIAKRQLAPYKNVSELSNLINDETITKNLLTTKSYIFKIESTGIVNKTEYKITIIYNRETGDVYYWGEM